MVSSHSSAFIPHIVTLNVCHKIKKNVEISTIRTIQCFKCVTTTVNLST